MAKAILSILQTRGLPVTTAEKNTILRCQDQATLERWLPRAMVAASAAELLAQG